ncbi:hypothetical protein SAMN05421812_107160 [Asanoa hainanensis]|uniref:Beta/Gamma crystallin n=1 Tax=Asanoa hainanensis TaxID=560556 RepID=A0A239N1Y4_9ACTN|nr:hypothetical protein [Asanoa hainanensis]SNT48981.1 hypothetical protein SAMN05421812_107160 [Asanoa hainanensis]
MRILRSLTVALLVTVGLLSSPAVVQASAKAAIPQNYIQNFSETINIGVIHNFDLNYTHGNYDTLLGPGHRTTEFWNNAEGFYIGPGWCARLYMFDPYENSWVYDWYINGPTIRSVVPNYSWGVAPVRCSS